MITEHQVAQGTSEWHEARRGKFTGSNAYKLLGTFGASEYAKALQASFKGNYFTKRGHLLEDEAIELYEAIKRTPVSRIGFVTNDLYPDCLYSPDGLTADIVVEVKCFNEKEHRKIAGGDIPMKVLAQIHFGMLITERKAAHLVIYNPDLEPEHALKIIDVKFNKAIADNFKRILST